MQRPLESQPGERFNYTNAGYFILGHLIQKLTGQSYETFIRENIFTPLGMKDSGLDGPAVIARRAGSYTVTPNGLVNASYASDRIRPNTAAGMHSTTEDLLRWQNGLYGGKVISKASLQKMTTAFKGDYGLGVYIRTIDGRRAATHGGGAPPFANLTYFLDRGISVVVLGESQRRTRHRRLPRISARSHTATRYNCYRRGSRSPFQRRCWRVTRVSISSATVRR